MTLREQWSAIELDAQDALWDIAIVDEAHRMSAHYKNGYGETSRTSRFRHTAAIVPYIEAYRMRNASETNRN